jgi:hypothetical protein
MSRIVTLVQICVVFDKEKFEVGGVQAHDISANCSFRLVTYVKAQAAA